MIVTHESGGGVDRPRPAVIRAPAPEVVDVPLPCGCAAKADWDRGDRRVTCDHGTKYIISAEPVRRVQYTARPDLNSI